jgi:riboflavin kinase/FMN adenylyltransferase
MAAGNERGRGDLEGSRPRVVATLGVFDGMHLGHCTLLERVRRRAAEEGAIPAAVTFDPPPRVVLASTPAPFQITLWPVKRLLLTEAGIERILLLQFTKETAALSPEAFIENVVLGEFALAGLVIGYDFRFGAKGAGDAALLRRLGETHGFWVEEVQAVRREGEVISSTRIREALQRGSVGEAAGLLGRPFAVQGTVIKGAGLGHRELVPTANLVPETEQLMPAPGVYLVQVLVGAAAYSGVAMLGGSPTLEAHTTRLVEVHLLDFQGDLLGHLLELRFLERMREGRRFAGIEELRRAIAADIRMARRRLPAGGPKSACQSGG